MKTRCVIGCVLIALPIISMAIYAISGQTWWVDASRDAARQILIGALHWLFICAGSGFVLWKTELEAK